MTRRSYEPLSAESSPRIVGGLFPSVGRVLSDAGSGNRNEDKVGYLEQLGAVAAWVIDGATQLDSSLHRGVPSVTDFVESISNALQHSSFSGGPGKAAIYDAMTEVRREKRWSDAVRTEPSYLWPIATMAWVRTKTENYGVKVEALIVGDCRILISRDRKTTLWGPDRAPPGEVALNDALRNFSGTDNDRREFVQGFLRQRRSQQNQEHPSHVLSLSQSETELMAYECVLHEPARIFIMTDGLFRFCDLLNTLTPNKLGQRLANSWDDLLVALRRTEADLVGRLYTRHKLHDDASVIEVRVQPS